MVLQAITPNRKPQCQTNHPPHGGFISEGTVIHGTLISQDLLRAFADEYERVLPFNGSKLANEARECADEIDSENYTELAESAPEIINELFDALDTIAQREGLTFGAHPGDGSDFGYWTVDDE